jgi:hypothetical protein
MIRLSIVIGIEDKPTFIVGLKLLVFTSLTEAFEHMPWI